MQGTALVADNTSMTYVRVIAVALALTLTVLATAAAHGAPLA